MLRALSLILALASPALAQSGLVPISGRVLDDATGKPISNATVHYRGTGGALDGNHRPLDPPSLAGQVITAADGSYTLPQLPPGPYYVRASAPGYFTERQSLGPHPANFHPSPPPPPPAAYCQQRYGKPTCTLPTAPDGIFHLHSSHGLIEMNTASLPTPIEGYSVLESLGLARFSDNGDRLLFAIQPLSGGPSHSAQLWIYTLSSQVFQQITIPPDFGTHTIDQLSWDGSTILFAADSDAGMTGLVGSATLPDLQARVLPTPRSSQFALSIAPVQPTEPRWQASHIANECDSASGQTSAACENPSTQIIVDDERLHRTLKFDAGANPSYLLNNFLELFFYVKQDRDKRQSIVEINLRTGQKLAIELPQYRDLTNGVTLLAMLTIFNEKTRRPDGYRVAYKTQDNCDPQSIELPPNFGSGVWIDPKYWQQPAPASVCFITVPALPAAPVSHAR